MTLILEIDIWKHDTAYARETLKIELHDSDLELKMIDWQ